MDFIHNSADTDSNLSQEALCFLAYKLLRGSIKPGWYSGCESESHLVVSDSLRPHLLYSPWNLLGQNTGVGSHSLLQGIFLTQGSNPGLPHCRRILYQLSHINNSKVSEKSAVVKHGSDPLLFLVWFFSSTPSSPPFSSLPPPFISLRTSPFC